MVDDAVIGFQHLRDIQKAERAADGLTEISDSFFTQAQQYIEQKEGTREGENAADILASIVDMRAKKMVEQAALNLRIADADTYKPEHLTAAEEQFYTTVSDQLAAAKQNLLPQASPSDEAAEHDVKESESGDAEGGGRVEDEDDDDVIFSGDEEESGSEEEEEPVAASSMDETGESELVRVEAVEAIPAFLGIDLKSYGPYSRGETAAVPRENAAVLFQHNKAKEIED